MPYEIPVTQARDELAELINRVAYGHERIMLTRHGKSVAGLVPPEDVTWLEEQGEESQSQGRADLTATGEVYEMQRPGQRSQTPGPRPETLPIAARNQFGRRPEPPGSRH